MQKSAKVLGRDANFSYSVNKICISAKNFSRLLTTPTYYPSYS